MLGEGWVVWHETYGSDGVRRESLSCAVLLLLLLLSSGTVFFGKQHRLSTWEGCLPLKISSRFLLSRVSWPTVLTSGFAGGLLYTDYSEWEEIYVLVISSTSLVSCTVLSCSSVVLPLLLGARKAC